MTPKDKAKQLFNKYAMYLRANLMYDEEANEDAKECALIAVNEILKIIPKFEYGQGEKTTTKEYDYWEEVKQEIEKL